VVIHEDTAEAAIAKDRAAQLSNVSRGFQPTRRLRLETSKLLQVSVLREPDVVSLQELKAEQEAAPVNALRTLGYEAVWQGERSWNGVAILARNYVPALTCTSLPGQTWGRRDVLHPPTRQRPQTNP
jgi:hypothetical protein